MKPINKYLINAAIECIIDSEKTPYMLVDATNPNTEVPQQFVENGKIILNVSVSALTNFSLQDEGVSFETRFSGKIERIFIPIEAVLVVFAKETGQGFPMPPIEKSPVPPKNEDNDKKDDDNKKFNGLSIVK